MKSLPIEGPADDLVLERLQTLGLTLLSEWDALLFLYHHSTSLGAAVQISRLIGHNEAEIGAVLHRLEALGLIERSRDSQGIRFYQFAAPSEPARHSCLLELVSLAQNRTGRLLLLKHLKRTRQESQPSANGCLGLA